MRTAGGDRRSSARFRLDRYQLALIVLFLLSLPFVNPWIHGDGVGYYGFAQALLIQHNLDFRNDWLRADREFRQAHTDAQGRLSAADFTSTGHVNNHFSIGPAILWSPFILAAHAGVLVADKLGVHIPPDGFSRPYRLALALATAFYGFLGLWISFLIARRYVDQRWAFLSTLGIWFASSLPVYMYFNPSWSHTPSVFAAALFLWYWLRTRAARNWQQWIVLGLLAGLMINVRYTDGILLLFPLFESLARYWSDLRSPSFDRAVSLFSNNVIFSASLFVALLPTLICKKIIYGGFLSSGYTESWRWNSPAFFKTCFSADHGFLAWTPILILAVAGLFLLRRYDRILSFYSLAVFLVYVYVIGSYGDWDGLASFGNRHFISLTPLFILGLAALFDALARAWRPRRALAVAVASTAILILWNFGMMYQWGMHLIPIRGPISWREAAYNQFAVVPKEATRTLERYLTRRDELMRHLEEKDVQQLRSDPQ
jgi:Dolichyl-phosphate-mannose-protein mannosyltransferase